MDSRPVKSEDRAIHTWEAPLTARPGLPAPQGEPGHPVAAAVCTTLGYHKKYPEAMKVLIMLSALPGTQAQLYRFFIREAVPCPRIVQTSEQG